MKRFVLQKTALILAVVFLLCPILYGSAEEIAEVTTGTEPETPSIAAPEGSLGLDCKSAILMDAATGTILYTQNADEALPPASVTKVMTLLLIMEAIDSGKLDLSDTVTVSANASSMGGSQVFLKEGEQMPLEEMLKCVVIASANDAAVALAEHLSGSVQAFVGKMNERAEQLGMKNTKFENVTGLDDSVESHLTSARDIAIMSRELLTHPTILRYSSLWMDSIRDGAFGLTNTNRLVRFYRGCTGLKTGSTSKAGFCVSATAERDGFSLVCVIMGAKSRDDRNAAAASLLDWGFANYGLFRSRATDLTPISVTGGVSKQCPISCPEFSCVLPKEQIASVTATVSLPDSISAPIKAGQTVGSVTFRAGDTVIGEIPIQATEEVKKLNWFDILSRTLAKMLLI